MTTISSTYRVIAFTLAFLMFVTSAGFTLDMHYCGGQLRSASILGKAKTCRDMAEAAPVKNCSLHQKMRAPNTGYALEKKGCCENKTLRIQSGQNQKIQTTPLPVSQQVQQFIAAYLFAFVLDSQSDNTPSFTHYKPPLIARDIPVLVQSFLL